MEGIQVKFVDDIYKKKWGMNWKEMLCLETQRGNHVGNGSESGKVVNYITHLMIRSLLI